MLTRATVLFYTSVIHLLPDSLDTNFRLVGKKHENRLFSFIRFTCFEKQIFPTSRVAVSDRKVLLGFFESRIRNKIASVYQHFEYGPSDPKQFETLVHFFECFPSFDIDYRKNKQITTILRQKELRIFFVYPKSFQTSGIVSIIIWRPCSFDSHHKQSYGNESRKIIEKHRTHLCCTIQNNLIGKTYKGVGPIDISNAVISYTLLLKSACFIPSFQREDYCCVDLFSLAVIMTQRTALSSQVENLLKNIKEASKPEDLVSWKEQLDDLYFSYEIQPEEAHFALTTLLDRGIELRKQLRIEEDEKASAMLANNKRDTNNVHDLVPFEERLDVIRTSHEMQPDKVNLAMTTPLNRKVDLETQTRGPTGKRLDYISWTEYFMFSAALAACRSKDPETQVGAIIVNSQNNIIGTGYNGFPRNCDDNEFPWTKNSPDLENTKHLYVIHAERNAIINCLLPQQLTQSTLFVTHFPCNQCAQHVIQVGISKVVYKKDEHPEKPEYKASRKMLSSARVCIEQYVGPNSFFLSLT